MSATDRIPAYRPFDQQRHLGEPPWRSDDPAVQAWEQAHNHDVRLKCYVEFGCMAIEYELDALQAVADAARELIATSPGAGTSYPDGEGGSIVRREQYRSLRAALARLDGEDGDG